MHLDRTFLAQTASEVITVHCHLKTLIRFRMTLKLSENTKICLNGTSIHTLNSAYAFDRFVYGFTFFDYDVLSVSCKMINGKRTIRCRQKMNEFTRESIL